VTVTSRSERMNSPVSLSVFVLDGGKVREGVTGGSKATYRPICRSNRQTRSDPVPSSSSIAHR